MNGMYYKDSRMLHCLALLVAGNDRHRCQTDVDFRRQIFNLINDAIIRKNEKGLVGVIFRLLANYINLPHRFSKYLINDILEGRWDQIYELHEIYRYEHMTAIIEKIKDLLQTESDREVSKEVSAVLENLTFRDRITVDALFMEYVEYLYDIYPAKQASDQDAQRNEVREHVLTIINPFFFNYPPELVTAELLLTLENFGLLDFAARDGLLCYLPQSHKACSYLLKEIWGEDALSRERHPDHIDLTAEVQEVTQALEKLSEWIAAHQLDFSTLTSAASRGKLSELAETLFAGKWISEILAYENGEELFSLWDFGDTDMIAHIGHQIQALRVMISFVEEEPYERAFLLEKTAVQLREFIEAVYNIVPGMANV